MNRSDIRLEIDLGGQVAIVTGAGRGIGRAMVLELARAGAAVAVVARSEDQLTETVALIEGEGGRALALPADVTEEIVRSPRSRLLSYWRSLAPIAWACASSRLWIPAVMAARWA